MNNTCPKCGTAYNVSAAVVGRKFTCKNCGTPVVVTAAGLDYQNAPPPPPPPAEEPAAGGAFDFDAPAPPPRGSKKLPPKPPRARDDEPADAPPRKAPKKRADDEPAADDLDELPARRARKPGGDRSAVKDFLLFREFIAPLFVKLLFVLAVIGVILGGLGVFLAGVLSRKIEVIAASLAYLLIGVPLNLLMVRILCELVLLGFAAYDRLGEIKSLLEKGQAVAPGAPPGPPAGPGV